MAPSVVAKAGQMKSPCFLYVGRTNEVHLAMLPKGEWPKWCKTFGGSRLGYCSRCLGTRDYRYLMGFHSMNREIRDYKNVQFRNNLGKHRVEDFLLNNDL